LLAVHGRNGAAAAAAAVGGGGSSVAAALLAAGAVSTLECCCADVADGECECCALLLLRHALRPVALLSHQLLTTLRHLLLLLR
jgi:hypothetical protein